MEDKKKIAMVKRYLKLIRRYGITQNEHYGKCYNLQSMLAIECLLKLEGKWLTSSSKRSNVRKR